MTRIPSAEDARSSAPAAPHSTELFLGRQPILDARENLVAFELLFRSGHTNGARIDDDLIASATVIHHVFSDLGVNAVLGHYTGYINLSAPLIMSDVIELLPPERVVLELLESVEINNTLVGRLRELRERGFRLALDDYVGDEDKYRDILELMDVVKVEVGVMDDARLTAVTRALRRLPARLLAEKVDTKAQVERCRDLGYELFQGYYFAQPSVISGRRLSHTSTIIMRLLGMVISDQSGKEIEQLLKQHPDLSLNLLRLVNSVTVGARRQVTSLQDAILLLGRSQLQRWLQLLMFTTSASPDARFPSPLLVLAATRGKLMESLCSLQARKGGASGDEAFLTGILSLVSALLSAPLSEILESLPIPPSVRSAVLDRAGELGALLTLTEHIERTDIAAVEAQLLHLPFLDPAKVNEAYVTAIEWANGISEPG